MARLDGKIALITAAGQGIGRATALRFANEGAIVWTTDINGHALDALRSENPAIQTRILDVLDSKAVETIAEETGTIDVLFNCAGFVHQGSIFECSENELSFSLDFNVTSMYRTCRAYLPGMLANGKRKHHQYVVNRLKLEGSIQPFRLRSNEGRRDRAYQSDCCRFCHERPPLQCPLSRNSRDSFSRRQNRDHGRCRESTRRLRRPSADGKAWEA
jgi:NAD(P)-dependent dehydrogenase (short-subunit alcohol dehydrogenase family)